MIRNLALAIAVAALTATLAHAGPRGEDVQAPRAPMLPATPSLEVMAE